jgi:hypothetical protein
MMASSTTKDANPFLTPHEAPRAHAAVAPPPDAGMAPLVSIDQIPHAIQASPTVNRPSKAPGAVSMIPSLFVKSGARKRRAMIVATTVILLLVAGLVGVMIFSRMR